MENDAQKYLSWIRNKPCIICGHNAVPHHTKAIGMGRNRHKVIEEHYSTIPVCYVHHIEIHTMGKTTFQLKYKINIKQIIKRQRRDYGNL